MNDTETLDVVDDDVIADNHIIFPHIRNAVEQFLQAGQSHVPSALYEKLKDIAKTWLADLKCSAYSWPERTGKEPASLITFVHKRGEKPRDSAEGCALVLRSSRADVYSYQDHLFMRGAEEIVDDIIQMTDEPISEKDLYSKFWRMGLMRPKNSIDYGFESVCGSASSDLRGRIYEYVKQNVSDQELKEYEEKVWGLHDILVDALCKDIKAYIANAVEAIDPPHKDILLNAALMAHYNWVLAATGVEQMRRADAARIWPSGLGLVDFEYNKETHDLGIKINPSASARIDAGQSAVSVFMQDFDVKPHTARALMRNSHGLQTISHVAEQLKPYTQFLDEIDPRSYPHNTFEAFFFRCAVEYVQTYAAVFGRDPVLVMRSLVKGMDLSSTQKWQDAIWSRTAIQRKAVKGSDDELRYQPDKLVEEFQRNANGIKDMQADIRRRIIIPLFLLEFEKQGYEALKLGTIEDIIATAQKELWARAVPSEQLAASSFWHSERVNFPTRRETAARMKYDTVWETILDEPYEMQVDDQTVVLVPMKSDVELRQEADVHKHCVYGYGIRCLKDAWHIFSIRDGDGHNLSTFSCNNSSIKNGRQQVELQQNLAYRNTPPVLHAEKAATEFIRLINSGELSVRWAAVHENRAVYLRDEVNTTVGYDFRDPLQRERMAEVYVPLMPRRITGALRAGMDTLGESLGIGVLVEEYISRNAERMGDLGLIRMKQPRLAGLDNN